MIDAKLKSVTPNLMVESVNETIEYYKESLGFKILETVPSEGTFAFAMMQLGGAMIMFQEKLSMKEEYPELSGQKPGGGLTLFIEVENVDYIYEQLKEKANVIKTPHIADYGMKEFAIQDCNGHVLTFAQRQ